MGFIRQFHAYEFCPYLLAVESPEFVFSKSAGSQSDADTCHNDRRDSR
jgi:hypothetical protein